MLITVVKADWYLFSFLVTLFPSILSFQLQLRALRLGFCTCPQSASRLLCDSEMSGAQCNRLAGLQSPRCQTYIGKVLFRYLERHPDAFLLSFQTRALMLLVLQTNNNNNTNTYSHKQAQNERHRKHRKLLVNSQPG